MCSVDTNLWPLFFVLPSNPRVPCKSGIIPSIDLTKWADYGQDYSPHQYVSISEFTLKKGVAC